VSEETHPGLEKIEMLSNQAIYVLTYSFKEILIDYTQH
jgi:hypothetical protein